MKLKSHNHHSPVSSNVLKCCFLTILPTTKIIFSIILNASQSIKDHEQHFVSLIIHELIQVVSHAFPRADKLRADKPDWK